MENQVTEDRMKYRTACMDTVWDRTDRLNDDVDQSGCRRFIHNQTFDEDLASVIEDTDMLFEMTDVEFEMDMHRRIHRCYDLMEDVYRAQHVMYDYLHAIVSEAVETPF